MYVLYMYIYVMYEQYLTQRLCHLVSIYSILYLPVTNFYQSGLFIAQSTNQLSASYSPTLPLFLWLISICYQSYVSKKSYQSVLTPLPKPVLTFRCLWDKDQIHENLRLFSALDFPSLQPCQAAVCFLFFMCLSQCLEFLFFAIQETEMMTHHPLQGQILITPSQSTQGVSL